MSRTASIRHHPASSITLNTLVVFIFIIVSRVQCEEVGLGPAAARTGLCAGAAAVASRSCFRIATNDEVEFSISPDAETTTDGTYYFDTKQRVTLTCKVKDAGGGEGRSPPMSKAVVFIQSCFCGAAGSNCPGWIISVPGLSESQLSLSGSPLPQPHDCQFACWLLDPDCLTGTTNSASLTSLNDLTVPGLGGCTLAALSGTFYTLQFGEQPVVERFQCLSNNWADLECRWTLSVDSVDNHVNCSLSYVYRSDSDDSTSSLVNIAVPGPELTQTRQGRQLRVGISVVDENFRRDRQYSFYVAVSTSYGRAIVVTNVTTDATIVKLSAARNVTVTLDDADSAILHVTWQLLEEVCDILGELSDGDLEFSVCATSMETWMNPHNVTIDYVEKGVYACDRRVTITGLRPFSNYSVTVRYKVPVSDVWGDDVTSSGITSEDKPSEGPAVMAGGFVTWSCGTLLCLTVYFGEVPIAARNGVITGYNASLLPFHNGRRVLQGTSVAESHSLTLADTTEGGQVCVAAGTTKGLSAAASCVLVPSADQQDVPAMPSSVTAQHLSSNHTYVIRWRQTGSAADRVNSQTVFWCLGRVDHNTTVKCISNVDWAVVQATTTVFVLDASKMADISEDNSGSAWYFGVNTLSVDKMSRGIAWNKCSYLTKAAGQTVVPQPGSNRRILSALTADADYFICFCAVPEAAGSDVCSNELPTFYHNGLTAESVAGIVFGVAVSVVFFVLIIRKMQKKYAQKSGKFAPFLGFEMPDGVVRGFNTSVYTVTNSSADNFTGHPTDATLTGNAHTMGDSCKENDPDATKPEIRQNSEAVAPLTIIAVSEQGKFFRCDESGIGGSGSEPVSEDSRTVSRDAGSWPLTEHNRTGLPLPGYFSFSDISSISAEHSTGHNVRATADLFISDVAEDHSDTISSNSSERVRNSDANVSAYVRQTVLSAENDSRRSVAHVGQEKILLADPDLTMKVSVASISRLGLASVSNSNLTKAEEIQPSRRVENLQYVSLPPLARRISSPEAMAVLQDQGRQNYAHRFQSSQDAVDSDHNSIKYVADVFTRFSTNKVPANADSGIGPVRERAINCEIGASAGSLNSECTYDSGSDVCTLDARFDAGFKLEERAPLGTLASADDFQLADNNPCLGDECETYTRLTKRDDSTVTRAASAYVNPASLT